MTLTIKGGRDPGKNKPCPCGSELKFKHCHGDPTKRRVCEAVMEETMIRLIMQTKFNKGMITEEELRSTIDPPKQDPVIENVGVEELQKDTGLKRCSCGIPIPEKDDKCIKCGRKSNGKS